MAEDPTKFIDKIIEGSAEAKEAIAAQLKLWDKTGKAMKEVSSQAKVLYTQLGDTDWVDGWAEGLDLQIAAAEAMGEINTAADRARFIREKEVEALKQQTDSLIANRRLEIGKLNRLQEQLDALGKGEEADKRRLKLEEEIEATQQKILKSQKAVTPEAIKAAKAVERMDNAQKNLAAKTEDMLGDLTGIGSQWKKTFLGGIIESANAAEGFGNKITAVGKGLSSGFAKAMTPMNLFMGGLSKIIEMTVLMVIKFDQVRVGFRQAQGVGKEWDKTIERVYKTNAKYSLTLEESSAALSDVRNNMISLRARGQEAVESMSNFIAPLSRIGIDGATAATAMETMMKGMKKSQPEAEAMTNDMISLAQALGKPPQEMIKEFNEAMPKLAAYGDAAEEVFKGMQVQAAATGVQMNKLISIAEGFDTFSDAAKNVGTLNAVLGGAYFNSLEMMNATHEERIDLLRKNFQATGKSFNQLGYYEKKAVAAAMGISDVNEAQKLLSTTNEDYAATQKAAAEREEKHQETMRENVTLQNQLMVALQKLGNAFAPLLTILEPIIKVLGAVANGIGKIIDGFVGLWKWLTETTGGMVAFGAIIAFFVATGGLSLIAMGIGKLATSLFWGSKGFFSLNTQAGRWRAILMILVPLIAILVDHFVKSKSPPFYIVLFIVAAGMLAIGRASDTMGPKMKAAGLAIMMVGAGVLMMTYGLSLLADSMSRLSGGQMVGLVAVLLVLIVGFTAMMLILAPLGPAILIVAAAFLIFGAGIALAGLGAMLFAKAIKIVVGAFISFIEALIPAIPQIIMLAVAVGGLALAMAAAAIAAPIFAIGLFLMAAGFIALASALFFIKTKDLVALGQIFMGLGLVAEKGAEGIGKLPGVIKSIIKELKDLDLSKIDKFTETLDDLASAAMVLAGIGPIGLKIGTTKAPEGGATATRVNTGAAQAENVKIATQAALSAKQSTEVTREVVEIIKEKFTEGGTKGEGHGATLPEGVLITRDVVVDLGREFDFKLRRKVEDIVERKIEGTK